MAEQGKQENCPRRFSSIQKFSDSWICSKAIYMGIFKEKKNSPSLATSPCAQLREAYHNCFNRWYSDKFLKGEWDKEECVIEWKKYRDCLSQHLDDRHLSRFLEVDGIVGGANLNDSKSSTGVPK